MIRTTVFVALLALIPSLTPFSLEAPTPAGREPALHGNTPRLGNSQRRGVVGANNAVVMGTVELKTGTAKVAFDKAALDVSGAQNTPEATGKIKNKTGQPITDVTIQIRNKGTGTGNAPLGGTVTITEGAKKSTGTFTVMPNSVTNESETTVDFSTGNTPIGSLGIDHEATIDIELTDDGSEPPSEFEIRLTASKKAPKGSTNDADIMGAYKLRSSITLIKQTLLENWHDRVVAFVENTDTRDHLVQLQGTLDLPPGFAINDAVLQDPVSEFNTVPGVTTTITGSQFTLNGFDLAPGAKYEIVVVFSAAPQTSTSLTLQATFEAP